MNTRNEQVDLVIVGSGPIGATVARVVHEQEPGARILVLERGPLLAQPPGLNVRNLPAAERPSAQARAERDSREEVERFTATFGTPAVSARPGTELVALVPERDELQEGMPAAAISTAAGGMGAHWTCAVPAPADGEVIPFLDVSILDDAFAEAARLLARTQDGFSPSDQSRFVVDRLQPVLDADGARRRPVQPMPLACIPQGAGRLPRWSGADNVFGDVLTDGVELRTGAVVTRIVTAEGSVSGVRYTDSATGEQHEVVARAVFVAADALRTPQLLWASGIRPEPLGRYLNDQPQIVSAVTIDMPAQHTRAASSDGRDSLTGVLWLPYDEAAGFPFHGQVMQLDASPIQIGDELFDDPRPRVGIGLFVAKELRAKDRVWFDDETDDDGLPVIRLEYDLTRADRDKIDAAMRAIGQLTGRLGEFVPNGSPRLLPAGSSLHYQGTTRMGTDPADSVCDVESRVWGFDNLFVGGNGVIPTSTACNPTYTSVALAVLAARAIADDLGAQQ